MLDYVPKALVRFQHSHPAKPQHQPYLHVKPIYGATKQNAMITDTSLPLNKAGKKFVQEVIGTFYTTPDALTVLCSLHSVHSPHSKRIQRQTHCPKSSNSLITPPHTQTPLLSSIAQATWSWQHTAMHHTYQNQMHAVEQANISSCLATSFAHQTTAQSLQLPKSSRQ